MNAQKTYSTDDLLNMKPNFNFFVGIDSDGCVFETMEIKQKKCFHSLIISHWKLEPIERYVRESAEFVNLYSKWRGQNRFPCLVRSIDLLRDRPEVTASGVTLPEFASLRKFMDSGKPLGNPSLKKAVEETGDAELASVLKWSEDVNISIAATVRNIPPYRWARKSLERIAGLADAVVVSQTPTEALVREWDENGITRYVRLIAGQELGTKSEHIALATRGRYAAGKVLMLGDAPGDLKAARENHAAFFPINPGMEEASWERFYTEGFDRFLSGTFVEEYQRSLIDAFEALLPGVPPWKKRAGEHA